MKRKYPKYSLPKNLPYQTTRYLPLPPPTYLAYQPRPQPTRVRRKVFISYHHADEAEVRAFVDTFDHGSNVLITRGIGAGMSPDIINSSDPDYVMRRIRALYLRDSTVTIVMIGNCTWSRKYVDWELQASLRNGQSTIPNGVLGIRLSSYQRTGYPERLNANLLEAPDGIQDCYARVSDMPQTIDTLVYHIEKAFQARTTRQHLIENPRRRMLYNRSCGHPWH